MPSRPRRGPIPWCHEGRPVPSAPPRAETVNSPKGRVLGSTAPSGVGDRLRCTRPRRDSRATPRLAASTLQWTEPASGRFGGSAARGALLQCAPQLLDLGFEVPDPPVVANDDRGDFLLLLERKLRSDALAC